VSTGLATVRVAGEAAASSAGAKMIKGSAGQDRSVAVSTYIVKLCEKGITTEQVEIIPFQGAWDFGGSA
jgi:hypothetical protein